MTTTPRTQEIPKKLLARAAHCAAKPPAGASDRLPISGVFVRMGKGKTDNVVEATDGRCAIRIEVEDELFDHKGTYWIPKAEAARADQIGPSDESRLVLTAGAELGVRMTCGDHAVETPPPSGDFPSLDAVLPKAERTTIRLGLDPWLLMRVAKALGATAKQPAVVLEIQPPEENEDYVLRVIGVYRHGGDALGALMPARADSGRVAIEE